MSTKDDRHEFEAHKEKMSVTLGENREVMRQSTDLLLRLHEFDYPYLWSWMGLPIIQMPADVIATQEVIWKTKPDVIIETGVARGGSLIFMASILAATAKPHAKVIGVDIDIREHNRESIENHPLNERIVLIQGGSTDEDTIAKVKTYIPPNASVMVVLDSDHSFDHVLAECRAYGPLVTNGYYLVVADTAVGLLNEGLSINRSKQWKAGDDPLTAVHTYLKENPSFEPDPVINGKLVLSSSPGGYLRRKG